MASRWRWIVWIAVACGAVVIGSAQDADSWSEAQVIERFLAMSPQAQELRTRVALAESEAKARIVYPNPSLSYSREGAGYNEFVEASQTLPINRRIRYLKDAGEAAVGVADADRDAALWLLRSDLRVAFYRMLAAQERIQSIRDSTAEVERMIQILRKREQEGEGSRYDRLRAERELGELKTDEIAVRSAMAAARADISQFLPEGAHIGGVRGSLNVTADPPSLADLSARALKSRAEFRSAQRLLTRYGNEEQAARRLRIPNPEVTVGLKRADVVTGATPGSVSDVTRNGVFFSLNVPLPVFHTGRYEVAKYQAEQEQVKAQAAVLARRIQAEVQGAREVLAVRREALATYQGEMGTTASELTRITQIAYQEGEAGILELLDSLRLNRMASLRLLDLQLAVREAWIDLDRAVGEELSQEVHP